MALPEHLTVSAKAIFYYLQEWNPWILLVHHYKGFWVLPGGRLTEIETSEFKHYLPGSTPDLMLRSLLAMKVVGLMRELREEIGGGADSIGVAQRIYSAESIGRVWWNPKPMDQRVDYLHPVYLGTTPSGLVVKVDNEINDYRWIDPLVKNSDINYPMNTRASLVLFLSSLGIRRGPLFNLSSC